MCVLGGGGDGDIVGQSQSDGTVLDRVRRPLRGNFRWQLKHRISNHPAEQNEAAGLWCTGTAMESMSRVAEGDKQSK